MQQLSANNKQLRRFELREKRLMEHSQATGQNMSTVIHYNVIENQLTQKIVYGDNALHCLASDFSGITSVGNIAANTTTPLQSQRLPFWQKQPPTSFTPVVPSEVSREDAAYNSSAQSTPRLSGGK
jgi:hypothetical protein